MRFPIKMEKDNEGFVANDISDLRFKARQILKVSVGFSFDCDSDELVHCFRERGWRLTR
jgi:hypothetical protein